MCTGSIRGAARACLYGGADKAIVVISGGTDVIVHLDDRWDLSMTRALRHISVSAGLDRNLDVALSPERDTRQVTDYDPC